MEIDDIKAQIANFLNTKKQELFQEIENIQTEEDKNNIINKISTSQNEAIIYVANQNDINLEERIALFPEYPIIESNLEVAMYLKMESFGLFSSFGKEVLNKLREKM